VPGPGVDLDRVSDDDVREGGVPRHGVAIVSAKCALIDWLLSDV
jgi:hypothetical protein